MHVDVDVQEVQVCRCAGMQVCMWMCKCASVQVCRCAGHQEVEEVEEV